MFRKQRGFWNFVIPAVAAVAGSALSSKSQKKAAASAADSAEAQNAANIEMQKEMNEANLAAQKEFAQHGIRWKVEDAKAAGLHPLFGAGLTGASFSPSFQVANTQPVPSRKVPTDYSWLASLGQLLGNFLNQPEARPAQQSAAASQGDSQRVIITEHPGGGRSFSYPIQGLESQVSGTPMMAANYMWDDGTYRHTPQGLQLSDPRAKDWVSSADNSPFWQRFSFGSGFNVILPKTSEPQEVFEDKPLWFWAMVAKANVKEYGPGWLTQARSQFPSLREVWSGVVQELEASGILPAARSAIPSILRR